MTNEEEIMTVNRFGYDQKKTTLTLTNRRLTGLLVTTDKNNPNIKNEIAVDSKLETIGAITVTEQNVLPLKIFLVFFCLAIGPVLNHFTGVALLGVVGWILGVILAALVVIKFPKMCCLSVGLPGQTIAVPIPFTRNAEFRKFADECLKAKRAVNG